MDAIQEIEKTEKTVEKTKEKARTKIKVTESRKVGRIKETCIIKIQRSLKIILA